jgi:hypothetical protein
VTPAIAARLVEAGPTGLRFRHPLVRSAIEYRAGLSRITAAHEALAAVLPDQLDRRTWHRAAAALGPDENVATELDQAASRAERRAAISVAITALERAVELSLDPAARNSRLLRAAQLSFELGRPVLVDHFTWSIVRTGLNLSDRARLALLQESVETGPADGAGRIRYLAGLWFVRQAGRLYLLPGAGSDSQWYKNVLKTPAIGLASGRARYSTIARPVTDPGIVARIVEDFRTRYGADELAEYYPNPNPEVAVEVTLQ